MTILEQVAASYKRFRPLSATDFFALSLAHKLDDDAAASHYASLASRVGQNPLLVAYGRAKKNVSGGEKLAQRFHKELESVGTASWDDPGKLLALRIERRTIAVAVFIGTHLDFTQARELLSVPAKAEASTIGFLDWLSQAIPCDSAALELETRQESRREALNNCAETFLRNQGVSLWLIPKRELLPRFGLPAPESRAELRTIIRSIWPVLDPNRKAILDATALGLYVQTERLFTN